MLLKDLHLPLIASPTVWCDNQSSIALVAIPIYHAQTKHIEVDVHFFRENVINRDVRIHYISTWDQVADIFTKGLASSRFQFLKPNLLYVKNKLNYGLRPPIQLQKYNQLNLK